MTAQTLRVLMVSVPSEDSANQIARRLVEERLAACVTSLPGAKAIYRWQGKMEESQECILWIKTTSDRQSQVIERVVQLHPDEVPEVLALPVETGHHRYLQWVNDETRGVVY